MSQLVVDASIVLSWLLPDESNAEALGVRNEMLSAERTWAPGHWKLELANSLWMAERRKRLDSVGAAQAVALISQLPIAIDPETDLHAAGETLALARQHGISVYDAAYLELAMRRGAVLASLDGPLRAVAVKLGVSIRPRISQD